MASKNTQRLAGALAASRPAGEQPRCWYEPALVTAVTAGAAYGGDPLVTVLWRGGSYNVPYFRWYTPQAGDTVQLAIQPPQVFIAGVLIGRPV